MLANSHHVRESDAKHLKVVGRHLSVVIAARVRDDWQGGTAGAKKCVALALLAFALMVIWAVITLGPLNEDMNIVYSNAGSDVSVNLPAASRHGCVVALEARPFACQNHTANTWFFPPADAEKTAIGYAELHDNQSPHISPVAGVQR
jgi:hypothetical protein